MIKHPSLLVFQTISCLSLLIQRPGKEPLPSPAPGAVGSGFLAFSQPTAPPARFAFIFFSYSPPRKAKKAGGACGGVCFLFFFFFYLLARKLAGCRIATAHCFLYSLSSPWLFSTPDIFFFLIYNFFPFSWAVLREAALPAALQVFWQGTAKAEVDGRERMPLPAPLFPASIFSLFTYPSIARGHKLVQLIIPISKLMAYITLTSAPFYYGTLE